MHTKLTLSADPEVVVLAKRLAKEQGLSVSALFANIVRACVAVRAQDSAKPAPGVSKLRGIIKLSKKDAAKSDRQLIEEAMAERHA